MSLFITSLNSGSNGNCYYVGNDKEAVLVDAGISCRDTEKRMKRLGLPIQNVKAVFISHEHGDHIRGVEGLSKKHQLPVYITTPTLHHSRLRLEAHLVSVFKANEPVYIGGLSVLPFSKQHDASDPYSFMISFEGVNAGVFTDIGIPCNALIRHFKQCHAAFLEANYDETMLEQGSYPHHLKNRIRGGKGHLSNMQALDLFITHKPAFMSHLLLAHLSKNNNNPKLVYELFNRHANGVNIIVASRDKETDIYKIIGQNRTQTIKEKKVREMGVVQTSLF